jgi:hypothetical protein
MRTRMAYFIKAKFREEGKKLLVFMEKFIRVLELEFFHFESKSSQINEEFSAHFIATYSFD